MTCYLLSFHLFFFFFFFFFFNDTATTEIYTLSLHDALRSRIGSSERARVGKRRAFTVSCVRSQASFSSRSKSTRLNSSHVAISYAVFCLKKKKNNHRPLCPQKKKTKQKKKTG